MELRACCRRCISRAICAMQGHMLVLNFEAARLSLKCAYCGSDSNGWSVAEATRGFQSNEIEELAALAEFTGSEIRH